MQNKQEIYFDNSATTKVLPQVADLACRVMCEDYGNPSALYGRGLAAEKLLAQARTRIAKALNVLPREIIFTSGGTEANNLAIRGVAAAAKRRGRHIIVSAVEHPAVLRTAEALSDEGFEIDLLPVDENCQVRPKDLAARLRPDTVLVSVMLVNNEVGAVQPIAELANELKKAQSEALLHVDAVQAFGKMVINPREWGVDMLSVSGHKLHAPKGTGFLYVRDGVRFVPQMTGGGQEAARRSGTENMPGICALGLAAKLAYDNLQERVEQVAEVKERLLNGLSKLPGWQMNTPEGALPNVLNISFDGIKSEVLLHMLEEEGLMVSSGSACAARKDKLSHVLTAMGYDRRRIEGAIRFSFSCLNTVEEADRAAKIVCRQVEDLRLILAPSKR
ncbi:MAG: cysteine desulfurase [Firmicutes bacterium]|nr:cysteine desulfurase [Bacillota bacterium]